LRVISKANTLAHPYGERGWNGVSSVCGDIWDFELANDPENPECLKIIDRNFMPKAARKTVQLKVWGVYTMVRTWGMSTDVPQSVRHSIMMGGQGRETSGNVGVGNEKGWSSWNKTTDNIHAEINLPKFGVGGEKCSDGMHVDGVVNRSPGMSVIDRLKHAYAELSDNRDDEAVKEAKGALKAYISSPANNSGRPADKTGFIPVSFDCTFDGIGGLLWGHTFKVDVIEKKKLIPSGVFQISNVNHSVTHGDWTTSIDTVLRP
jgi:hypothetical protein